MEKDLQTRVENFFARIESDESEYRNDPDMGYDTIERHVGFLSNLNSSLKTALEKLKEKELSALIDSIEAIYSINFFSGTDYGTCYGARQALIIVNNINSEYDSLGDEQTRLEYIKTLEKFYKIRARFHIIPINYLIENISDGLFPSDSIPWLNEELKKLKTPQEKTEFIKRETSLLEEHYEKQLRSD